MNQKLGKLPVVGHSRLWTTRMAHNRERFFRYVDSYAGTEMPDTPQQVLASFRETPKASSLMRRFVKEILPAQNEKEQAS